MQRIRTLGEIQLEINLSTPSEFRYQQIAHDAAHLRVLGLNYNEIGRALGVDEKTAKRAVNYVSML